MATKRKADGTGQFDGSTTEKVRIPEPAPLITATAVKERPTTTRRPVMKPSSIECWNCEATYSTREWDGEEIKLDNGDTQEICSQCIFDGFGEESTPKKINLTDEQYQQMKRSLYPTKRDIEDAAGDPEMASHDTQSRIYWAQVMQGEIDPNQFDDPWAQSSS